MQPPDEVLAEYARQWRPALGLYASADVVAEVTIYQLARPLSQHDGLTLLTENPTSTSSSPSSLPVGEWGYSYGEGSAVFGRAPYVVYIKGDANHTQVEIVAAARALDSTLGRWFWWRRVGPPATLRRCLRGAGSLKPARRCARGQ